MKTSILSLAAVLTLTSAPSLARATELERAYAACTQAFTKAYLPAAAPVKYQLLPAPSGPLSFARSDRFEFILDAKGTVSGQIYGRALCTASLRGAVLRLKSLPEVGERLAVNSARTDHD